MVYPVMIPAMNEKDCIRTENSARLEAILNRWLQQGGASSTWGQLMKALKEDYLDVVNNIEEFLVLPLSKAIKQ